MDLLACTMAPNETVLAAFASYGLALLRVFENAAHAMLAQIFTWRTRCPPRRSTERAT